jgi:uncharacterized membrane protein YdfJ with MMPL/SSD domain
LLLPGQWSATTFSSAIAFSSTFAVTSATNTASYSVWARAALATSTALLLLALLSWPLYSPAAAASMAANLFCCLHVPSSATLTNDKNKK